MLGRRAGDAAGDPMPGGNKVLSIDDLRRLATDEGRADDPHIRQKLAELVTWTRLGAWNAARARADAARGGAIMSIAKLVQTRIMKLSGEIALDILGPSGMLNGPEAPGAGRFADAFVFARASSIYGGTDEIQHNIIGERTLGLPREPNPDKDQPFGEVLRRTGVAG
jgi:alkylation response protein AidB-like acyl-CoA dehydrogenase